MPSTCEALMQRLYGTDIWTGFEAAPDGTDLQGWNGNHPSLARLASTKQDAKVVIDVGVWKGQSTISMAKAMKANGIDGVVIAVDTFLGSPEPWSGEHSKFQRKFGFPDIYTTFLTNTVNSGVTDYVIPVAQTSSTAAKIFASLKITASVIHVDAAHEYREVINDLNDYWELLAPGGFLIGDDYDRFWPGVIEAAGEFSARKKRPLMVEGIKFILQK